MVDERDAGSVNFPFYILWKGKNGAYCTSGKPQKFKHIDSVMTLMDHGICTAWGGMWKRF